MAQIPKIFIKDKSKLYYQCSIEELEQSVKKSEIKKLIVLGLCSIFFFIALFTIIFMN